MKVKPFRIPKAIVLPGLVVQVSEVPPDGPELEGSMDGAWEYLDGAPRIWLNREMPLTRKRYMLLHELHHVIVDYLHTAMQEHPDKVKP
mgnify:FL=1